VRVRQLRDSARFAVKAFAELRIGCEPGWQNLDCDGPVEPRIPRLIDLAHAASTEQRQDFVRTEARAGAQSQSAADYTRRLLRAQNYSLKRRAF
jgi:hypothetical protein